jgi:hypothetical protein
MWKDVMTMKRLAFAAAGVAAVIVVVTAWPGTADGHHGRGGVYISNGGFSIAFGAPAVYGVNDYHYSYPYRGFYGRPGFSRRGFGGTSLFFSFGTGRTYGFSGGERHYGRYGPYPRHRYRSFDGGRAHYPDRGRRVWISGGMHDGRYRFGYWDYRGDFRDRNDRRGRGRDRY